MNSDILYLLLLLFMGIKDLRHRQIKNWHIMIFIVYILLTIFVWKHISGFVLLNFLIILLFSLGGYVYGIVGAQDVKVIAISSFYNFYRYNTCWFLLTIILTGIIDILLWVSYFKKREEHTPLLFSWMLANYFFYLFFFLGW